ncbi:hypothetical protein OHB55_13390 [Micromonospora ureilytica]|nr:hypothetical protein OHB55_13390 [Micromonospora ureilytica]
MKNVAEIGQLRLLRAARTDRDGPAARQWADTDLDTWFQFGLRGLLDGLLHGIAR